MVQSWELDCIFDQLPSIARFDASVQFVGSPDSKPRPFRDPAGMIVLRQISVALLAAGYEIATGPRPGKGCDAGLTFRSPSWSFFFVLVLSVRQRSEGNASCAIRAFPSRPLLQRILGRVLWVGDDFATEWRQFCNVINDCLLRDVHTNSISWSTRREDIARAEWDEVP